ncbi:MAG: hypothetical protein Q9213_002676 [Squamulea squamosa]
MDGWREVARLQLPLSKKDGLPTGIGTLGFDTQQELLWIGTDSARVSSYYGADMQKYVSTQAHPIHEGRVAQLLFHERGVISITSKSVHMVSRRGLTQWHICEPSMTDLKCMSFIGKSNSEVLIAGCQRVMYKIDIDKGVIVKEHDWYMMKFCRYICAGTSTGAVHFLDPDTLSYIKTWQAHSANLSDMDAQDSYLVTCGWSTRPHGPPTLESFAKVYDLKKLEQLPPIPFHTGAAFVQMHPKLSTTSIISSMNGQLQVANILDPNTSNLLQANLGNYMSQSHLVLTPSGAAWALAELDGSVQIWAGSPDNLRFTESAVPIEFADEVFPLPYMDIDSDIPFSVIGMPYYREKLLSAWSDDQIYEVGFPPPKIDPEVLKNMTPSAIGFRAPNPRKTLRNQMDRMRIVDSDGTALAAPRFLSQKHREANGEAKKERRISDAEAFTKPDLTGSTKADVPVMYRLMEIKYSRYGVDDFDFGFFSTNPRAVGISSRDRPAEAQWHLFNDFLVRKVDKDEALRFATTWKTPNILTYQYQGGNNAIDDSWKNSLDTSCLFMNWSLNPYNVLQHNWPCILDPATEQPGSGMHMPIDTEFVRLQQEEIEILATGDRQVIRPTREGLARVSVLRADGPNEGLPFIDDYISISEPVVDYVTKYSGVSAGDLDPAYSVHPLVPLKVAYKKLWLLLNLGCVFVGHGLTKDFRNINMFVPKPQMVDTVTLFYNPSRSKRNLSLRFLAWYLLKENIQSETHDSIEDAFTALKLWKKYQEFEDAGILEKMIDEIYTAGRKWNYKVPEGVKGEKGAGGGGLTVNRGRDTPDVDSGVSRPTTPVGKKGAGSEYSESPLK